MITGSGRGGGGKGGVHDRNAAARARCAREAARATTAAKQRRRTRRTPTSSSRDKTPKPAARATLAGGSGGSRYNDNNGGSGAGGEEEEGTLLAVLEVGVFVVEVWSPRRIESVNAENDVSDAECWVYHYDFGDDVVSVIPFHVLHKALFDAALRSSAVAVGRRASEITESEVEEQERKENGGGDMFHAAFAAVSASYPALKNLVLYGSTTSSTSEGDTDDADYHNAPQQATSGAGDEEEYNDDGGIHPLDVFDVLTYLVLWQRMSYPAQKSDSVPPGQVKELYADRGLLDAIVAQRQNQSVGELSKELDELEQQVAAAAAADGSASPSQQARRASFSPVVFLPYPSRIDG